ncbi:sigma-70 family RNA polymerase sigma factor [Kribbella sp. NPDC026611]|uniref:sigma-70 family RNA polymerase sigma factor n=1 Tax=Kribbella sp. NPDC026611 TaxID=3154911 RepID=UPI0033EB6E54
MTTEAGATLETYRVELTGYCYRMLGSPFDADDAVQETLARAWQHLDRYDASRGPLRPWLYKIATNICLDVLRSAQRRTSAMELAPRSRPGPEIGEPLPESAWILPVPDQRVISPQADPADHAALRESVRLAFMTALHRLPPRQRAVLILRDVLCWQASEVAALLDTTVASVNSALQRARSTTAPIGSAPASDEEERQLLDAYCAAFERYDVDALVALLHKDAISSMPPYTWWLRGRDDIRASLIAGGGFCAGARVLPTLANGSPAYGQYLPVDGGYQPFALVVLTLSDGLVAEQATFLQAERLFPLFDLPLVLPDR